MGFLVPVTIPLADSTQDHFKVIIFKLCPLCIALTTESPVEAEHNFSESSSCRFFGVGLDLGEKTPLPGK